MSIYVSSGSQVVLVHDAEGFDRRVAATCADALDARVAVTLLNRARRENDIKRRYTAAARLIARAEALPGFTWVQA